MGTAFLNGQGGGSAKLTADATDETVLNGSTYYNTDPKTKRTGTMANNGAVTITPSTAAQTIPAGYHNGNGTVVGDTDLIAGNIKSGVNIFGVLGSLTDNTQMTAGDTKVAMYYTSLLATYDCPANQGTNYLKGPYLTVKRTGTVRIFFEIICPYTNIYAKVYVNGVAVGTERIYQNSSGVFMGYTEDFSVAANQEIAIYWKIPGGSFQGTIRNFTIKASESSFISIS